jgi:hypothetical protein
MSAKKTVKKSAKKPTKSPKKPAKKPSTPTRKTTAKRPAVKKAPVKKSATVKKPAAKKPAGRKTPTVGKGAGGRMVSVSTTLPEEAQAKISALQTKMEFLQESLLLTQVQQDMDQIGTGLAVLPAEIEELRTRGYVFRSYLDNKVSVLSGEWDEVQGRVGNEVTRRTRDLEREGEDAWEVLTRAAGGGASNISRAESVVGSLESQVAAALSAVGAMYGTLETNVNQSRAEVDEIRWLLDAVDEGSFQLYPAEDPVAACRAQLIEDDDEGPEGILFLTDERLIFEQREEVATKKVLFITTEKETVQETLFAVHVGHIEEIKTSQKGFLGRKEILDLTFSREADIGHAMLRLMGVDNEEWVGLIGRVRSGEIAQERTTPKEEAAVEAAREAPTKCPTCNATLDVEIVRGMREITCEYCGSVIRL